MEESQAWWESPVCSLLTWPRPACRTNAVGSNSTRACKNHNRQLLWSLITWLAFLLSPSVGSKMSVKGYIGSKVFSLKKQSVDGGEKGILQAGADRWCFGNLWKSDMSRRLRDGQYEFRNLIHMSEALLLEKKTSALKISVFWKAVFPHRCCQVLKLV